MNSGFAGSLRFPPGPITKRSIRGSADSSAVLKPLCTRTDSKQGRELRGTSVKSLLVSQSFLLSVPRKHTRMKSSLAAANACVSVDSTSKNSNSFISQMPFATCSASPGLRYASRAPLMSHSATLESNSSRKGASGGGMCSGGSAWKTSLPKTSFFCDEIDASHVLIFSYRESVVACRRILLIEGLLPLASPLGGRSGSARGKIKEDRKSGVEGKRVDLGG